MLELQAVAGSIASNKEAGRGRWGGQEANQRRSFPSAKMLERLNDIRSCERPQK